MSNPITDADLAAAIEACEEAPRKGGFSKLCVDDRVGYAALARELRETRQHLAEIDHALDRPQTIEALVAEIENLRRAWAGRGGGSER